MATMDKQVDRRIAWLLPAMGTGGISFQHILAEFTKSCPDTMTFTGQWPGYAAGFEDTFAVQEVGATRYIEFGKTTNGYTIGFSYASPQIVGYLLKFKPQIVFANAFSAWTAIALLLKPIGGWKVIVTYEGGSPTYESQNLSVRLVIRRLMVGFVDAFVVNSQSGTAYLTNVLRVPTPKIFARPFLVPSVTALLQGSAATVPKLIGSERKTVFLFVGQIIPRKGLKVLLEACALLMSQGYDNFMLKIVGDGEQKSQLTAFAEQHGLKDRVEWLGKVEYGCLGGHFQSADVFVFPTYEDIWGMVLTEAMAFGLPVICSNGAGAAEMVQSDNGFVFDMERVDELTTCLRHFLDCPESISKMGEVSKQIMLDHTPERATQAFIEAVESVNP